MLTKLEIEFMNYWEKNRDKEKKWNRQLMIGFPMGLLFATPILVVLFSGRFWYVRAEAAAQSSTSPVVMIIAVLFITTFVAFFYKRHQWEMKEQLYRELKAKLPSDLGSAAKEPATVSNEL